MTNEFLKHQQELASDLEYRSELKARECGARLALQIKSMRESAKLSQGDLARLLNTTQSRVSQMEDPNYGKFTLQSLARVTEALGYELIVDLKRMQTEAIVEFIANEDLGNQSFGNVETHLTAHNPQNFFAKNGLPFDPANCDDSIQQTTLLGKISKNVAA